MHVQKISDKLTELKATENMEFLLYEKNTHQYIVLGRILLMKKTHVRASAFAYCLFAIKIHRKHCFVVFL